MPKLGKPIADALVSDLKSPDKGNVLYYDPELPGFAVRVTAAGTRSFVLVYRFKGVERRDTIGQFRAWDSKRARVVAKRWRRDADLDIDPNPPQEDAPTVADLAQRYREDHLPRKRPASQRDDESMLKHDILPALDKLKVADVRPADVKRLHRQISKGVHRATTKRGAPYRANRVASLLSRMFNLSIRWGWRADNPCRGLERNQEDKRRRYLKPAELASLAAVLEGHAEHTSAALVRFLLLSGARFGEAARATWAQFDLEAGTWTKPSSHTKQKQEHMIPLSAPARQLLAELKAANGHGDYVFPGSSGKPLTTIKHFWASVCKAADIEGARIHDLRHTHASILASAGLSLPIIGALLGHTQVATTGRYAHLFVDPLREATERVGAVVTGRPSAAVVQIRRGNS